MQKHLNIESAEHTEISSIANHEEQTKLDKTEAGRQQKHRVDLLLEVEDGGQRDASVVCGEKKI